MVTNGTDTAHWDCESPVGMAGGIALNPTQAIIHDPSPEAAEAYRTHRGDDLTADFMALAGSHMATTRVLARLVRASRSALMWTRGDNFGDLLDAIEAAEKDLGL